MLTASILELNLQVKPLCYFAKIIRPLNPVDLTVFFLGVVANIKLT
jgi:hypothetical protein